MLNVTTSALVYLAELLISFLFFSNIAEKKKPTVIVLLVGCCIFGVGAWINLFFHNTVWINLLYFFAENLLFSFFLFDIRLTVAAFYSILLVVFSTALEFASIFIVSAFYGTGVTAYNSNPSIFILEASVSKLLYLLSCLVSLRFVKQAKTASPFPIALYLYPFGTFACLVILWYICAQGALSQPDQYLLAVVSVILFGLSVLLFFLYQHNLKQEGEYLAAKQELELTQVRKSYYDILEHQNRQLMMYAHDAKNHLAAIKNLNQDARIDAYLTKLDEDLRRYSRTCRSGNVTLDVLISKYTADCEIRGIAFSYDINLCNLRGVDDSDLVTILGNLLDNAVTAAEQSHQKKVSLETAIRNLYDVIVITNSCHQPPVSSGNLFITTKEEKGLHGIGLKSVAKALKKYGGDFDWDYDAKQEIFVTTVMLKPGVQESDKI